MDKISIVVPCYNEEESIPLFYEEIKKQEKKMNGVCFELWFVDDGSKDKTWDKICYLKENTKFKMNF